MKAADKLKNFESFTNINHKDGDTYEAVIDACGHPSGIETAKNVVRKRGTIVMKSTYAGTVNVDMSYFFVNEITIMGSRCGPFEPALKLLNMGLVNLPAIELWDLKDYEKALVSNAFKVGFKF